MRTTLAMRMALAVPAAMMAMMARRGDGVEGEIRYRLSLHGYDFFIGCEKGARESSQRTGCQTKVADAKLNWLRGRGLVFARSRGSGDELTSVIAVGCVCAWVGFEFR